MRPHTLLFTARLALILTVLLLNGGAGASEPAGGAAAVVPQATRTAAQTPSPTWTVQPTSTPRPTRTTTASQTPTRTPTATPRLPESATIEKIYGYGQLFPLSCEARSASDWARHFGVKIREMEFLARLPRTDNPETGFVGRIEGDWGNIPPHDYGVHAAPVARVLQEFGAEAQAMRHMSFDQLRGEIAAGRPVMVWVTGHVQPGKGEEYIVDHRSVTVARYAPTVIAIGYDSKYVTFLDGKKTYRRPIQTFLDSWSALENMAIIWLEE